MRITSLQNHSVRSLVFSVPVHFCSPPQSALHISGGIEFRSCYATMGELFDGRSVSFSLPRFRYSPWWGTWASESTGRAPPLMALQPSPAQCMQRLRKEKAEYYCTSYLLRHTKVGWNIYFSCNRILDSVNCTTCNGERGYVLKSRLTFNISKGVNRISSVIVLNIFYVLHFTLKVKWFGYLRIHFLKVWSVFWTALLHASLEFLHIMSGLCLDQLILAV